MEFGHVGLHLQPDLPPILQKLSGRSAKAAGVGLMTVCPFLSTVAFDFGAWNECSNRKNFPARICGIGRQHRYIHQGGIFQWRWPDVVVVRFDPRSIHSR
jgi:hypothetical protein